ncbi:MAG: MoaD family protein [Candidatus Cloacimonetes bacterium]|nr:MoaD family protein [Candidatus Cloacimonadota bacterium]
MITIKFYSLLRLLVKVEQVELALDNVTISQVLAEVQKKVNTPFLHKLVQGGSLITGTVILINGRNIHHLHKLDSLVKRGDEISLFPPGGGG